MKKTFLATVLLTVLTMSAIAADNNAGKMLAALKASLKNVNVSSWTTKDFYKKTSFTFNGQVTSAYVDVETNDLIGFGITIIQDALPAGAKENLEKKYKGWNVTEAAMFIDASGNIKYYTQVNKGRNNLVLSVSQKGRLSIYTRLPR